MTLFNRVKHFVPFLKNIRYNFYSGSIANSSTRKYAKGSKDIANTPFLNPVDFLPYNDQENPNDQDDEDYAENGDDESV